MDHHYPGSENKSQVAVLYGEIGTPEFAQFHKRLRQLVTLEPVDYVLRHFVKVRTYKLPSITVIENYTINLLNVCCIISSSALFLKFTNCYSFLDLGAYFMHQINQNITENIDK